MEYISEAVHASIELSRSVPRDNVAPPSLGSIYYRTVYSDATAVEHYPGQQVVSVYAVSLSHISLFQSLRMYSTKWLWLIRSDRYQTMALCGMPSLSRPKLQRQQDRTRMP